VEQVLPETIEDPPDVAGHPNLPSGSLVSRFWLDRKNSSALEFFAMVVKPGLEKPIVNNPTERKDDKYVQQKNSQGNPFANHIMRGFSDSVQTK